MNVNLQGNLKKRRESGLMIHKLDPKQRKENEKERIQTKYPSPPPAKAPFAKQVIRQQRSALQRRSALLFKKPVDALQSLQ